MTEFKPPLLLNPNTTLMVFDQNITNTSPAGSCLLRMLEPIAGKCPIHLFVNRTDLPDTKLLRKTKIPLPKRPVFARAVLFTLFSMCAYAVCGRKKSAIRISTEGAFPFCQIAQAQYCHRFFLSRHASAIAGNWIRRAARILTHSWGAWTERVAFRSARKIVVPSRGLARELESVYPALVREKITVIPSPVDTAAFLRPSDFSGALWREQLGIPENAFVLSFCALGNFERKGLGIVLEALASLRDLSVHLVVIGGTRSEIREYEKVRDRLGISSSVHFAGFQKDIRPYFWSSDAYVFPSIYETFCLACFQAAAAGLPLITTSFSGIEEFIVDGVNGWIVERTSESVAAGIREAALNPERTAAMGRTAQSDVQAYKVDRFQARWMELLK
ncbi:MAG: glycosyltransferase family 4 protein, partial [Acidobacteriaceae bacterium]|nr:glycosyltransferase family 4 protein [Acidobacteriaceae bacterium]